MLEANLFDYFCDGCKRVAVVNRWGSSGRSDFSVGMMEVVGGKWFGDFGRRDEGLKLRVSLAVGKGT